MSSLKPIAIHNEGDENMDNSSVYAGVTMLDVLGSGTNRKMDIKDHRVKVCIYTSTDDTNSAPPITIPLASFKSDAHVLFLLEKQHSNTYAY
jgi:hypothetical protein